MFFIQSALHNKLYALLHKDGLTYLDGRFRNKLIFKSDLIGS